MASDFDKFLKKYGKDDQISGTDIKDATKAGYSFAELDKFTKKANKQGLKSGNSTQIQLDEIGGSGGGTVAELRNRNTGGTEGNGRQAV